MKYTREIEVDLPRARVVELFDDPDNMPRWQEGLLSFEPLSGEPGQVGDRSRLRDRMGKRELERIETITHRDLPAEFSGTHEAPGMWNEVSNAFEEVGDARTRWRCTSEFRGRNLMMKAMLFPAPSVFREETLKFMTSFEEFAEAQAWPGRSIVPGRRALPGPGVLG